MSHASVPFSILHVKSHPYAYNYAIQTTGPHDEAREAILDELKKYCNETRGYYDSAEEFGYAEEFIERSLQGIKMIVAFASVFMFIALLISMLGLIAMSSYFAGESTKGIAIHKLFGGTVKSEAARNIFKPTGTLLLKTERTPKEKAISVAIGMAIPLCINGSDGHIRLKISTGTIIPPHAPIIGRRALSGVDSSPTLISLLISRPTDRKNMAIRKSLMNSPSVRA